MLLALETACNLAAMTKPAHSTVDCNSSLIKYLFLSHKFLPHYPLPGAAAVGGGVFPSGEGNVYLRNLNCNGSEEALLLCPPNEFGFIFTSCSHSRDAGVVCKGGWAGVGGVVSRALALVFDHNRILVN